MIVRLVQGSSAPRGGGVTGEGRTPHSPAPLIAPGFGTKYPTSPTLFFLPYHTADLPPTSFTMVSALSFAIAFAALGTVSANPNTNATLLAALADAPTRMARNELLADSDFVFYFTSRTKGATGVTIGLLRHAVRVHVSERQHHGLWDVGLKAEIL